MPYSYQIHIPNTASTGPFSFQNIDGYLSLTHLKVYLNGTLTTAYTMNTVSKTVTLTTACAPYTVVRIQRETPKTVAGRVVDFTDGSILTAGDLDNSQIQNLYIAQEAEDNGSGALGPTLDGANWDAVGKRIANIGIPIYDDDAVTKRYMDGVSLYGEPVATPQAWSFTGDGTTTIFSLSPTALSVDSNMFIVEVGGVLQRPTTDYTVSVDNITFVGGAPGNGVGIRVRNFGLTRNIAAFNNAVTFNQNATFSSTITANGSITANAAVTVNNNISVTGTISGKGTIPIGGIIMWSGSTVPTGWVLCNGLNGTPDLRNKFIIGGSAYTTSAWRESITGSNLSIGGSKDSIVVSHTQTTTVSSVSDHTHTFTVLALDQDSQGTGALTGGSPGAQDGSYSGITGADGGHTHTVTIGSTGSSGTNQNLPPFYALAFIMRSA